MFSGLPPKRVRSVALLGRLGAAWEILQEFAMHHCGCSEIELRPVDVAQTPTVGLTKTAVEAELKSLQCGLGESNVVQAKMNKLKRGLELVTHAEMQLLAYHGSMKDVRNATHVFPYIGSSRRTCWLCEQMIRGHGYFTSRGSHGEVSAHWTINPTFALGPSCNLKLTEALYNVQFDMVSRLERTRRVSRPAIPQSTAAVTKSESAATMRKAAVRSTRKHMDARGSTGRDLPPRALGKHLRSITAIRLPVIGTAAVFTTLEVFDEGPDGGRMTPIPGKVLDLSTYWGMLHTEPMWQLLDVQKQQNAADNGSYMIFYTTHDALPLNKYALRALGITEEDTRLRRRLFWCGDIFVVRSKFVDDKSVDYLSLPDGSDMGTTVDRYLDSVWKDRTLERLLESQQWMVKMDEEFRRNKELLRARLYALSGQLA